MLTGIRLPTSYGVLPTLAKCDVLVPRPHSIHIVVSTEPRGSDEGGRSKLGVAACDTSGQMQTPDFFASVPIPGHSVEER